MTQAQNEVKVTRHMFFPTQVWVFKHPDQAFIQKILDFVLACESNEDSVVISNRGGWQSRDDFIFSEELAELREQLNARLQVVLDNNQYRAGASIELVNGWANVNRSNHYNLTHTHGRSDWSCAFYLTDVEDSTGAIYFNDPVMQRVTNGATNVFIDDPGVENWDSVEFKPDPGDLIFFPSWLPHGVHNNSSGGLRVSISCNFRVG